MENFGFRIKGVIGGRQLFAGALITLDEAKCTKTEKKNRERCKVISSGEQSESEISENVAVEDNHAFSQF